MFGKKYRRSGSELICAPSGDSNARGAVVNRRPSLSSRPSRTPCHSDRVLMLLQRSLLDMRRTMSHGQRLSSPSVAPRLDYVS